MLNGLPFLAHGVLYLYPGIGSLAMKVLPFLGQCIHMQQRHHKHDRQYGSSHDIRTRQGQLRLYEMIL